jgi:hypothetical protein
MNYSRMVSNMAATSSKSHALSHKPFCNFNTRIQQHGSSKQQSNPHALMFQTSPPPGRNFLKPQIIIYFVFQRSTRVDMELMNTQLLNTTPAYK